MGDKRMVEIRNTIFVKIKAQSAGANTTHGAGVFPADLVFVVIVAHDQATTVQIDGLTYRVLVIQSGAVDGDFDAAGLVLDGQVLVAVAALVGADDYGLDDEDLVRAADGVLGASAQIGMHGLDIGDGMIGGGAIIHGHLKFGFLPAVAGAEQTSHHG